MAQLLVVEGVNKGKTFELKDGVTTIGRDSTNSIVFLELAVSRHHAQVVRKEGRWTLEDLGSKNGTRVNGAPITGNVVLKPGDTIALGKATMRFELESESGSEVVLTDRPLADDPATIVRPLRSILDSDEISSSSLSYLDARDSSSPSWTQLRDQQDVSSETYLQLAERRTQYLGILIQVAKELITPQSVDELLEVVMNLVFKVFRCDRGFIFLLDGDSQELRPKVVRYRSNRGRGREQRVSISNTIAQKAIQEKVSILTSDALVDPRFHGGESIQLYGIRSAMCVPLWNKDSILGIIHVDSLLSTGRFTTDDLDLLTAMANQAAIGIENARLAEQLREEVKRRANLERYHTPWVVERILAKQNARMDVVEQEATILFSDICGFTNFAEHAEPQVVATLLNEYFTLMTDAVFEFEGTLDKFMGDAIMALFGLPFTHDNDEERAVLAALKMNEALKEYNEEKPPQYRFRHRISINTGRVVAGDVGSARRMEYTALGDAVNSAQRMLSIVAKPDQVVIGERTFEKITDRFITRALGVFELRGKTNRVKVYEVLGACDRPSVAL
ncbi:MAG: FHA domain-containing protein [Candidatus Schekmanbacteria bacterium]|nr:FHA domain-containing protein [Candidatus Schekmanbacteria bacterium]